MAIGGELYPDSHHKVQSELFNYEAQLLLSGIDGAFDGW